MVNRYRLLGFDSTIEPSSDGEYVKWADYAALEAKLAEKEAERERLRKALKRLLASPALADENHSDPEWGCEETAIAVTAARRALEGGE